MVVVALVGLVGLNLFLRLVSGKRSQNLFLPYFVDAALTGTISDDEL